MSNPVGRGPSRAEAFLAYATTFVATLAWAACVVPGVRLADASLPDDLATPMARGAALLVPALLLLVAMPVAAALARHVLGLRALLAWAGAFVAAVAAIALAASPSRGWAWVAAAHAGVVAALCVVDGLRVVRRAGAGEDAEDMSPGYTDLRLAVIALAVLAPASVMALGPGERASWLAPIGFVVLATLGERFGRTLRALRRACVICMMALSAHLAVAVRYLLDAGEPAQSGWLPAGWAALALCGAPFALGAAWLLALRDPRPPASLGSPGPGVAPAAPSAGAEPGA